jgi:hypothetical protein
MEDIKLENKALNKAVNALKKELECIYFRKN